MKRELQEIAGVESKMLKEARNIARPHVLSPCSDPTDPDNVAREFEEGGFVFRAVRCDVHGGYFVSVATETTASSGGRHYETLAGALSGLRSTIGYYENPGHGPADLTGPWTRLDGTSQKAPRSGR